MSKELKNNAVNPLVLFSINHPRLITCLMVMVTLLLVSAATLPNVLPKQFSFLPALKIDTDPENMLSNDEPARVFNHQKKSEFGLSDIVVVGITNDQHQQGVFNTQSLHNIDQLTQFA
ncbi:MAG: hypothetical protein ACPHFR_08370, partial [Cycloclasticus sp.]